MEHHERELLGDATSAHDVSRCLIKNSRCTGKCRYKFIRRRQGGELGGEPKTEMWYIADAAPGRSYTWD